MIIQCVDPANRDDVHRFIQVPFDLYHRTPQWVPPFVRDIRAQFDRERHPFYQHSEAAFFLALEGEEVVGRIAVLDNARYNSHHGTRTAWFHHFDVIEDRNASQALLDAACDWAQARGLDLIWGPRGLWHLDGQGLLVEGFEHRPAMGIPYNHPYYAGLLEEAGFEKRVDFVSCIAEGTYMLPKRFLEIAERIKRRRGFRSAAIRTKDDIRALIPQVVEVYNESFTEVQGFVPMTEAEGQGIGERLLRVADPDLISLLMKGDELAGFVLAYPDISAAIQRCRGRMWPTGWFHILREFRRTRWINFNGAGIRKAYRGLGGNAVLYAELYRILSEHPQYDFADMVQIQETNTRMMHELQAMGLEIYKRHRLYQRSLA